MASGLAWCRLHWIPAQSTAARRIGQGGLRCRDPGRREASFGIPRPDWLVWSRP